MRFAPVSPDERGQEAALEAADHHLRRGRLLPCLRLEALEEVEQHGRVLDRVLLDALVDDEGHALRAGYRSTRPNKTQPLWPPRPIAFESATSTLAWRASFGT